MAKRQTKAPKQPAKGGVLLKLIILMLLLGLGWQLYLLHGQVQDAQATRQETAQKVAAKEQENSALEEDIQEGPTTEKMKEMAREQLDYVAPGEYVFEIIGAG